MRTRMSGEIKPAPCLFFRESVDGGKIHKQGECSPTAIPPSVNPCDALKERERESDRKVRRGTDGEARYVFPWSRGL